MSIPDDIAQEQRGITMYTEAVFIVRHDNHFDFPSTWAFKSYAEAIKLRDKLNGKVERHADMYHVDEEVLIPDADELIAEMELDGWFDDE
jgi:hypothetical protein